MLGLGAVAGSQRGADTPSGTPPTLWETCDTRTFGPPCDLTRDLEERCVLRFVPCENWEQEPCEYSYVPYVWTNEYGETEKYFLDATFEIRRLVTDSTVEYTYVIYRMTLFNQLWKTTQDWFGLADEPFPIVRCRPRRVL